MAGDLNRDHLDLLRAFIDAEVRFLIVGAHAVGYHAQPRATGDLDLWIEPSAENAARAHAAIAAFGAPLHDLTVDDLSTPGIVFQMGVAPNRIDVMNQISGVEFPEAWATRIDTRVGGVPVSILGFDQLLANKRAAARAKDAADVEVLERVAQAKRRTR